ncbi:hypothetical protein [Rhizobium leguminosarum]|uniref:hypothetical protein n=1 Tax=Rhizobium leguminosarum TaxID=384 RepID=UPI001C973DE2|nr:hypothetical protein [Rhizobium leguminosarum]MBY5822570.1 hypothetical protein [Rhizobium leguminosarum]
METSRHIFFAILTFTVLAAGTFRTEILARVDAGDVVGVGEAVTARNVSASDRASAR